MFYKKFLIVFFIVFINCNLVFAFPLESSNVSSIPSAVIKFAQEKQMENVKSNKFWNVDAEHDNYFHGYKVYSVTRKGTKGRNMILYKDANYCLKTKSKNVCKEEIRFATPDEIKEIIHVYF